MKRTTQWALWTVMALAAVAAFAASTLTFKEGEPQTFYYGTKYPWALETTFYSQAISSTNGVTVTNLVFIRRFGTNEIQAAGVNTVEPALPYLYAITFENGLAVNNYALVCTLGTNVVELTSGQTRRIESAPSDGALEFGVRAEKPGNARRFK